MVAQSTHISINRQYPLTLYSLQIHISLLNNSNTVDVLIYLFYVRHKSCIYNMLDEVDCWPHDVASATEPDKMS